MKGFNEPEFNGVPFETDNKSLQTVFVAQFFFFLTNKGRIQKVELLSAFTLIVKVVGSLQMKAGFDPKRIQESDIKHPASTGDQRHVGLVFQTSDEGVVGMVQMQTQ